MFRWRSSSKENKDKPREHDASAMDFVTGQNIPPKTFNPFQELQPFMQLVNEVHERSGPAMDVLDRCCKDNQEKEEKIGMQAKEIHALTDLAAEKELTINQLQGLLRQKQVEMEAFHLQAQEVERKLREENSALNEQRQRDVLEKLKLDDELKRLNLQISRLSEDLHAREEQVKLLNQQLKEQEGMQKKAAFLLSRVQSLMEDVKAKELKYKDAHEKYQGQLSVNGKLCNENSELQATSAQLSVNLAQAKEAFLAVALERDTLRTAVQEHEAEEERKKVQLQERDRKLSELKQMCDAQVRGLQGEMMQLMGRLESRNAEFSAVVAEKEKLTSENQQLKANEEGLHCLLREKDKENTELQQDYDRQCQHLMNVKAFVVNAVDTVAQPVRYNSRPRHKAQESATASGDLCKDASGASTEPFLSTSLPQSSYGVPQLPAENLPDVSTDFLMPYLNRISVKWYELAHALGVGDVAENLKQTEQDPVRKCLQCLQAWIDRGPEVDCSWEKLLCVLNMLQLHAVAQEIQGELWRRAFTNTP